ncbi:hypothetical protein [Aestuariivirga litoralis]|uniref:hypothetical protein n=1 Tax=Aestuariivirga litoralis TaxID=2650924 RepID=UPI0018C675D4|nr:hypothetical protein [Aestuariivirga litoralis]MBG1233376.1 hypothetical protein [Aestuariivirga litoralis]
MLKYAIAFVFLFPAAAYADRIDGTWCNAAGAQVTIEGPRITLSSNTVVDGQYSRHEFLYTVPPGRDHAGEQIYMRVMDDEDMTSFIVKDGKGIDPMAWTKCAQTS